MSLLVLSASDVREVVSSFSTNLLQDLMGRVFVALSRAGEKSSEVTEDIQTPHRTAVDMKFHTTLFMPARISSPSSSLEGTSIKVVSVPSGQGDSHGLPATTLVLDEESGAIEAVVNARELTALRNAAGSLLSTTLVGLHNPAHIVCFGAGKQIESHINVFLRHFPGVHSCTLVNRTLNQRASELCKSVTAAFKHVTFHLFSMTEQESIQQAVENANIIICATSSVSPLFPSAWVNSGTHVILIGSYKHFMQEVDEALVQRAISGDIPGLRQRINQVLLVDSREACMNEAGDLIKAGVGPTSVLELGELITKCSSSAETPSQIPPPVESVSSTSSQTSVKPITMFKSVGVGLQDVVIAKEVVSRARKVCAGTVIERYDTT